MSIVANANHEADSWLHCIPMDQPSDAIRLGAHPNVRDFIIPRQSVIIVKDSEYGIFSILRVTDTTVGPDYWLVTSEKNRMGFLLPFDKLPPELLESEGI